MKFCLMASHGYTPGLVLQQELNLGGVMKSCQPVLPSPVAKPEIIRYQSLSLRPNPFQDSWNSKSECFGSNQFVNVSVQGLGPVFNDVQATCPNEVLFSFGIAEQCARHDKIVQFLMSGTAKGEIDGVQIQSLSDMCLQLLGIDVPQQPLSPSLIFPNRKFYIQKPVLDFVRDSALGSKVRVHPDGLLTFMGTSADMKDLLSVVAESYLSKNSQKGAKQFMLVPHFNWLNINEAEARSHSSTLKNQSILTAPLRSPEKLKVKPSPKKNKKSGRERDTYRRSYSHACESLLSIMVDKKQRGKTAILSLRKSGPELPELLTQVSVGIAGTGLAVLLSVICNLACGRVSFCATKLLNTGFGFGLVWLSGAVNKLRDTVVSISKNGGKPGLKDEEMIQKLDNSIREVYFRAAAALAVAVLRFA